MKKNMAKIVRRIGAPIVGAAMLSATACGTFNPIQYITESVENSSNLAKLTSRLQEEGRIAKILGVPREDVVDLGNGYKTGEYTKLDLLIATGIVTGDLKVKGRSKDDLISGRISTVINQRLADPEVFNQICALADTNNDHLLPSYEVTRVLNKVYEVALR